MANAYGGGFGMCRLLACNFANQLDDIFLINDSLDELASEVEKKFVPLPLSESPPHNFNGF